MPKLATVIPLHPRHRKKAAGRSDGEPIREARRRRSGRYVFTGDPSREVKLREHSRIYIAGGENEPDHDAIVREIRYRISNPALQLIVGYALGYPVNRQPSPDGRIRQDWVVQLFCY